MPGNTLPGTRLMLRLCYDMSAISLEYSDDLGANLRGYDTFTGDRDPSPRILKCGRQAILVERLNNVVHEWGLPD